MIHEPTGHIMAVKVVKDNYLQFIDWNVRILSDTFRLIMESKAGVVAKWLG